MQTKMTEPLQNCLQYRNCILRTTLGSTFRLISDFISNSSWNLNLSKTSLIDCPYLALTSLGVSLHCVLHWDYQKGLVIIVINHLISCQGILAWTLSRVHQCPWSSRNYCWEIEIIMFSSSNPDVVSISWQLFLSDISQGSETLVPREGFPFLKSINSNCQSCK